MIEILVVYFIATAICAAVYVEWTRRKLSKIVKHLPGPPEIPVLGSLYAFQPKLNNEMETLFRPVYKGPISKIFIGNRLVVFIAEPKAMYQFFTSRSCLERPFIMKLLGLDGGLISAHYKLWKPLRKDVNVYFNQRTSLLSIPKFIRHYSLLAEEVGRHVGKEVNLRREMMQRNIKLILETTMNIADADPRLKSEVMEIVDDCVSKRILSPTYWAQPIYRFTQDYHEDRTNRSIFNEVFEMYIKQKEQEMKGTEQFEDEERKKIYLDTLFKLRDELNLTLEEVRNNLVTIFLTGYETTAIAMNYTIMMLAMYPEFDKKVEEEIFEHYTPGDEITYELLKKLTYLEQVLKEAMRLFPPAPLTLREVMEPVELEGIGKLPKGVLICAHMYYMQRSKEVWGETAETFDPAHFEPEYLKTVDPHAWMPFTAGPRNCIGYSYAMMSMKVCLLTLLSQYKFTTTMKFEDIKLRYCINIKMIGKEELEVHRRRPQVTEL